ncbi:calcium/sodium antiporter [candidate division KSB1 bacterium]|nr:calcium/sodium antiporter [candidate division KSB1 bacterium]
MTNEIIQIMIGLLCLYLGAEALVNSSSSLAKRLHISPLIIGLTIVAFGTSMPELIVSIKTSLSGHGAISIGNVVGSNIFNIAVILGVSALICPIQSHIKLIRIDTPIMILVSILFAFFFHDRQLGRFEGAILFTGIIIYTFLSFYLSKRSSQQEVTEIESELSSFKIFRNIYIELAGILIGLALLIFGANMLIDGSIRIAQQLEISEAVIGITIVASGTSLPELATSLVAAIRRNSDIAIGNVIGSNIFNILSILGISSLLSPINTPDIRMINIYVMLLFSIILLPFIRTSFKLSRWEGASLFAAYGAYISYLLHG